MAARGVRDAISLWSPPSAGDGCSGQGKDRDHQSGGDSGFHSWSFQMCFTVLDTQSRRPRPVVKQR